MNDTYSPVDAATGWAYSLTDPLLPLPRRTVFEDAMARVCATHPRWASIYLAGAVTCIAGTLHASDPWRHLRAAAGGITVGDLIPGITPGHDAVVTQDGQPFGTWRDAVDLLPPLFTEPESDPQLAALADPLTGNAGAVLAAAGRGHWRDTLQMLTAVVFSVPMPHPGVPTRFGPGEATWTIDGYVLRDVARSALVWAIHRRRAYVGWDDPFTVETLLCWASRAGRVVSTEPADPASWSSVDADLAAQFDQTVAEEIVRERVADGGGGQPG